MRNSVSTHAPLAGSDSPVTGSRSPTRCFNPRSPCGERPGPTSTTYRRAWFQPTLPLRGATPIPGAVALLTTVSTHAPLAGSDYRRRLEARQRAVSTHAPLAGSDSASCATPPARAVSTHAPLAGSDLTLASPGNEVSGFNPRSPCGERRSRRTCATSTCGFNPRSPCGERLGEPGRG